MTVLLAGSLLGATGGAHAQEAPAAPRAAEARTGPGDVIDSEPIGFQYEPGEPADVDAWKITYRSTSADGKENTLSGTVVVPRDGRTGDRPLVTYAVGTVGVADSCAPSAGFPDGTTEEASQMKAALERGYAVAVADYEGLGRPGDHTYMVGRAEGTAVLDAARAAQKLPEAQQAGVGTDSPVGIMGYSQGGQASAWAAELAGSYAPGLKVKGTASGGVPADVGTFVRHTNGAGTAAFAMMSAIGHDAAFPELKLDKYLNDEGRKLAGVTRNGCIAEILEASQDKKIEDLTTSNPLDQPDWQKAINANKLGMKKPSAPVFLYHGDADETVPYELGTGLRADWCAKGAAVDWKSLPGASHVQAAIDGHEPTVDWLSKRLSGEPTDGDCAS